MGSNSFERAATSTSKNSLFRSLNSLFAQLIFPVSSLGKSVRMSLKIGPFILVLAAGVGRFPLNSFIFPVKQGILPERPVRRNCMRHHARRGSPKSGWRTCRPVRRRGRFIRAKTVGIGRRVGVFATPALQFLLRRGLATRQRPPKQRDNGDPARAAMTPQGFQHLPLRADSACAAPQRLPTSAIT